MIKSDRRRSMNVMVLRHTSRCLGERRWSVRDLKPSPEKAPLILRTVEATSRVDRRKLTPIDRFLLWQPPAQLVLRHGTVLETALGKDRHVETGDRLDTTRNDFAFERVEFLNRHSAERSERNRFGYRDDVGPREWAETFEVELFRRRVGARVAPAQPAAVGQRMLDPPDAPALLVEHQVVHHAAMVHPGVSLEGIVFRFFAATAPVV